MHNVRKLTNKKNHLRSVSTETSTNRSSNKDDLYFNFNQLNGYHPWQTVMPEGCVLYPVKNIPNAKVLYFNFPLAKEMGLIPKDHPHIVTKELEKKLVQTFSIQIVNEYDQKKSGNNLGSETNSNSDTKNKYMATRYLQLQHSDKTGRTSGDGRGIWNGIVKNKNKTWDVSSRGTGVTCLAPGAVEANKPLKTGSTDYGYGCGLAEIDELVSAALMAEIIHLQGIQTERVLCVIDHENGHGIGVRAALNLFRPAHMFLYIKQNRLPELKKSLDFFINRQVNNKNWKNNYSWVLEKITKDFAKFAAQLEVEYIFAWLDWDGDNVLADAGIIDYGSIRQFGACHNQYRYDDVQRFSTNLKEQKEKAKDTVQTFAQIFESLQYNKKIKLQNLKKHPAVSNFEKYFTFYKQDLILYKLGLNKKQRSILLKKHSELINNFIQEFQFLENLKTYGKTIKVPDGINQWPLLNMRKILTELPNYYLKTDLEQRLLSTEFYNLSVTQFAKSKDKYQIQKLHFHFRKFQDLYVSMLKKVMTNKTWRSELSVLSQNSFRINGHLRMTGNALIEIVDEILLDLKKSKIKPNEVQSILDQIILNYVQLPEINNSQYYETKPKLLKNIDLINKIHHILKTKSDDI